MDCHERLPSSDDERHPGIPRPSYGGSTLKAFDLDHDAVHKAAVGFGAVCHIIEVCLTDPSDMDEVGLWTMIATLK